MKLYVLLQKCKIKGRTIIEKILSTNSKVIYLQYPRIYNRHYLFVCLFLQEAYEFFYILQNGLGRGKYFLFKKSQVKKEIRKICFLSDNIIAVLYEKTVGTVTQFLLNIRVQIDIKMQFQHA